MESKTYLFIQSLPALAGLLVLVTTCLAQSEELPRTLEITWQKGPNLPQGFQDSDGGIVQNTLITVGGFCSGNKNVPGKEERYPRGFLKKVWGLNLRAPQEGWQPLPDFPGAARQELFALVLDEQLFCWGGFSYSEPYCYRDGYRLSHQAEGWEWDPLPELPWAISSAGIAALGSHLYIVGGADYDLERFYTQANRHGQVPRLGARLLRIDTHHLEAGWQELATCPGTPRWVAATAAVGGQLYVFGGGTGNDNPTEAYCTVVDNWRYDPATDTWARLPDLPVASGNFPAGRIVFEDRYILLVGGYQYKSVLTLEGTPAPRYGQPFQHYSDRDYYSDVWVFDTQTGQFGTATPLPLNNNLPMMVVEGNTIHLIGGETAGCEIEGEPFGHHPDLYLTGTIKR